MHEAARACPGLPCCLCAGGGAAAPLLAQCPPCVCLNTGRLRWRWRLPRACPPWRLACWASVPAGPPCCTSWPSPTAWRHCWRRWEQGRGWSGARHRAECLGSSCSQWRRAKRHSEPGLCLGRAPRLPTSHAHPLQVHNLCSASAASLHQGVAALTAQVGPAGGHTYLPMWLHGRLRNSVARLLPSMPPALLACVRPPSRRYRRSRPLWFRWRGCRRAWPTRWLPLTRCSTRFPKSKLWSWMRWVWFLLVWAHDVPQ